MRVEVMTRDSFRLASERLQAFHQQAALESDVQFSMVLSIGAASLIESLARRSFQAAVEATCLADDLAAWSCLNVHSKRLKYARFWRRVYRRTHGV